MEFCDDNSIREEIIGVIMDPPELSEMAKLYPHLKPGGHNVPQTCLPLHKTIIVVPYR